MKVTILCLFAFLAIGLLAQAGETVHNPTCHIYLPTNANLTSWATSQDVFVKKGYTPIERPEADEAFQNPNELAAAIFFRVKGPEHLFGRNHCAVRFAIQELLTDDTVETHYTSKSVQKSRGDTPKCNEAIQDALKDIPQCELTAVSN